MEPFFQYLHILNCSIYRALLTSQNGQWEFLVNISLNRTTVFFGLLCLGYLLVAPFTSIEFSALLKIAPILFLSFLAAKTEINSLSAHLLLALLFSMGGDVLLEMGLFVPGLSSFLLAQFLYGSLFLRYHGSWSANHQISLLLASISLVMAYVMWIYAGDMRLPVIAYLLVITFMGLSANTSTIKGVTLGAAVFIFSDSIIAINRFVVEVPAADWLIMTSYYVAQFLLVSRVTQEVRVETEQTREEIGAG
ncbi:MAG: hypothetical protein COB20_05535 [SAR86 cluster bacterium]|uniref:Lysoplasmalogenase n=1 Tax=SAR86 cluster bacterium TaxID=2030880 RepID=A0A2A4XA73_9GAMM|nr:MAG: hypothetical protein COB20_05535 [SAR86 cluster bacterium]